MIPVFLSALSTAPAPTAAQCAAVRVLDTVSALFSCPPGAFCCHTETASSYDIVSLGSDGQPGNVCGMRAGDDLWWSAQRQATATMTHASAAPLARAHPRRLRRP